jgi:hypothetical protein
VYECSSVHVVVVVGFVCVEMAMSIMLAKYTLEKLGVLLILILILIDLLVVPVRVVMVVFVIVV